MLILLPLLFSVYQFLHSKRVLLFPLLFLVLFLPFSFAFCPLYKIKCKFKYWEIPSFLMTLLLLRWSHLMSCSILTLTIPPPGIPGVNKIFAHKCPGAGKKLTVKCPGAGKKLTVKCPGVGNFAFNRSIEI